MHIEDNLKIILWIAGTFFALLIALGGRLDRSEEISATQLDRVATMIIDRLDNVEARLQSIEEQLR